MARAWRYGQTHEVVVYRLLVADSVETRVAELQVAPVASSLCTTAHPLHARFSKIFGASTSETRMSMRVLNPAGGEATDGQRGAAGRWSGHGARGAGELRAARGTLLSGDRRCFWR